MSEEVDAWLSGFFEKPVVFLRAREGLLRTLDPKISKHIKETDRKRGFLWESALHIINE